MATYINETIPRRRSSCIFDMRRSPDVKPSSFYVEGDVDVLQLASLQLRMSPSVGRTCEASENRVVRFIYGTNLVQREQRSDA